MKKYCNGDISKIENYDKAVADKENIWHCHHRSEILPCGNFSRDTLKRYDIYYNRHAEELIFLTKSEHLKLHMTGDRHPFYGKHRREDTRQKISESKTGNKHPLREDTKKKMSQSHKGKTLSEYTRMKMSESRKGNKHYLYGKHLSEETKKKMSEAKKGIQMSDEFRMKISLAKKEYWAKKKMSKES